MLHRHTGFIGAVHSGHTNKQFIGRRISAQTHQRISTGKPEPVHQLGKLRSGAREDGPAAAVYHRTLGLQQYLRSAFDLRAITLADWLVRADTDLARVNKFGLLV